ARRRGLPLASVQGFESGTGVGVRGAVEGKAVALGNTALMQELDVDVSEADDAAERLRRDGASVIHVAVDGRLVGLVAVADPVKATSAEALQALRDRGIHIVMATGDGV